MKLPFAALLLIAVSASAVPSGFGADTVAWGSSVNGLRLGIAFGADPSKPTLRILLQNVGSAVQDVLIGYETGRGLSYVMKFIATAPDENKREGFHKGVFTPVG